MQLSIERIAMMKRLLTVFALGVGVSTAVRAQPHDDGDRRVDEGYRDHARGWLILGSGRLARSYQELVVGAQVGRFNRVRVDAARGEAFVRAIDVHFADHTQQTFDVRRTLRPGDPIELDLHGRDRAITAIAISGQPRHGASFVIRAR
jgi:hypothetical protein